MRRRSWFVTILTSLMFTGVTTQLSAHLSAADRVSTTRAPAFTASVSATTHMAYVPGADSGVGGLLADSRQAFGSHGARINAAREDLQEVARAQPRVQLDRISVDWKDVRLDAALKELGRLGNISTSYSSDVVPLDQRVTLRLEDVSGSEALRRLLEVVGLQARKTHSGQFVLVRGEEPAKPLQEASPLVGTIVGRVTEAGSGMAIDGATVRVEGTELETVSGQNGRFRIVEVPAGTRTVVAEALGYDEARSSVTVQEGQEATVSFALEISAVALDALVATGTAFETGMRTVPNPISVITAREIEQKQATNIADLLRGEIPGVMALSAGQSDYNSGILVRGTASWATADMIKIYIDGVEVAYPIYLSTIDPKSIERIEVVRGPQASVIYGSGASSGVLQIFTKKGRPGLDRPRLDFQASVGTIESDYVPSDGSRPLTQDHSLQVSGGGSEAFSYRAGTSYTTVGEWLTGYGSETLSFSGGLRAVQGPLTAELTALWSDRDLDFASSPIFWDYPTSPSCPQCGQPDLAYPNYDFAFSQNTMGLSLSYRTTERWQHTLILGDDQNGYEFYQPVPTYLTPADTFVQLYNQEYRRRSVRYHTAYEAELGNSVTGRFTVGADYWSYEIQGSYGSNLLNASGTVQTSENTSATFYNDGWWNAGYFGMAELGFMNQFFLTLATRVEDNPHLGEEYGRAVSPRVGASYVRELGPVEVKLRAQYGKGVRPPPGYARTGRIFSGSVYVPNPEIGPEEKVGWDAGVELYWGSSSLSLTRYEEEGKNLIQTVDLDLTVTPPISQYQNIGRVGSEGWEVEGRVDAGPVTVEANYAYSDNVVLELSSQYTSNPNSDFQIGDRMLYVPTHSGGGTVTWRFWRGSASLDASVMDEWRASDYLAYYDYLYDGEPYRGSFRDYYVNYSDALWKWNLRAEQALTEQFTAFLRVDNLANNQAADFNNIYVTPGRTTMLGVRFVY